MFFRWIKKVGDQVAQDEVVLEIETDKTSMPVSSPTHGIIEEILVEDGATVKSGQPLFKVKVTEAGAAAPAPAAAKPSEAPASPLPTPSGKTISQSLFACLFLF